MRKYTRLLSGALVAAARPPCSCAAARGRDDDDAEKAMKTAAARVAVLKLVGDLGKADEVKKEAADIAAKHDIEFVMNQFRPRTRAAWASAPAPRDKYDGIETELLFLGKKALPQKDLAAQQADLQKMAEVSLAISEIAHYAPKQDAAGMPIKDWQKYSGDMNKQSKDSSTPSRAATPRRSRTRPTSSTAAATPATRSSRPVARAADCRGESLDSRARSDVSILGTRGSGGTGRRQDSGSCALTGVEVQVLSPALSEQPRRKPGLLRFPWHFPVYGKPFPQRLFPGRLGTPGHGWVQAAGVGQIFGHSLVTVGGSRWSVIGPKPGHFRCFSRSRAVKWWVFLAGPDPSCHVSFAVRPRLPPRPSCCGPPSACSAPRNWRRR